MRRLLSLDFVLEHPGLNWLPTEGEKVEFIEGLGVHSNLIPRRIYYGAVRAQKRYFALKLPVAGGDKTVTFAYVDPGLDTTAELNSWGAAHGPLWDAIRAKERRVEVIAIGAELDAVLRADRMLQLWAAAEPGKVIEGLTVKQEISAIREALVSDDEEFMSQYGGMNQGAAEVPWNYMTLPEAAELPKGSRLTTIRRTGQHGFRSRFEGAKSGVFFMVQRTASLSVQGQRGGCTRKKRGGVPAPHSLNSFVSCGLPLIFGFENDDPEKSEETIATPPKRGVPTDPDSGAQYRPYPGP